MQTNKKSTRTWALVVGATAVAVLAACGSMGSGKTGMSFFVTSAGPGKGADSGGLAGADKQCQALATAAGAGNRTWRAYLSQQATANVPAINARDRIGKGPWINAKGVVVATDVENLHGTNNLSKQTALTETGAIVNGRGDTPNMHDILTGSQPNGTAIAGNVNTTCGNWTRAGKARPCSGTSDKTGLDESVPAKSWNSSHMSRGCSPDSLKATGGAGLFYCFARTEEASGRQADRRGLRVVGGRLGVLLHHQVGQRRQVEALTLTGRR